MLTPAKLVRNALIAGALVGAAALSASPAATAGWAPAGSQQASGVVSYTWVANGLTTICDSATAEVDLNAVGNGGTLTSFILSDCYVSTPGFGACVVELDADASIANPWPLFGMGSAVSIGGVLWDLRYSGGVYCPLNGLTATFTGSLVADYDNTTSTLMFSDTPGVSSSVIGPVKVNGQLEFTNGVQLD